VITTRKQLIDWVKANVADPVLRKCALEREMEVLGGFNPLPTSTNPGWLVHLKSKFGNQYYVAVGVKKQIEPAYYWFRVKGDVPWENWQGLNSDNPLYRGDCFDKYKALMNGMDTRAN